MFSQFGRLSRRDPRASTLLEEGSVGELEVLRWGLPALATQSEVRGASGKG